MDWMPAEVEAIVADYLKMLSLELAGQAFNKAAHRRALLQKLTNRTSAAIEFKHCNISAVMIELGFPYIRGYQPCGNYQAMLREVAEQQINRFTALDSIALAAVQQPAVAPEVMSFSNITAEAPTRKHAVKDVDLCRSYLPIKRDYLDREARNASLGLAGEHLVLRYEQWRLHSLGCSMLADRVEHVSQTKGDGLGYDVLSFDVSGRERFIEVKTTAFGKETPFFVTKNELNFSRDRHEQFVLCRVFEFRKAPQLFNLKGPLEQHCMLDPVTYRASFS